MRAACAVHVRCMCMSVFRFVLRVFFVMDCSVGQYEQNPALEDVDALSRQDSVLREDLIAYFVLSFLARASGYGMWWLSGDFFDRCLGIRFDVVCVKYCIIAFRVS